MSLPIVRDHADTVRIFNPATGAELDLASASDGELAEIRDLIRSAEEDQRLAKKMLDTELLSRMDRQAKWSLRASGFLVTGSSPAQTSEYDAHGLRADLEDARDRDLLTQDAVDNAVQIIVDYKARAAGIKALAKLGGEIAEIIERHRTSVDPIRRVSVKRPA